MRLTVSSNPYLCCFTVNIRKQTNIKSDTQQQDENQLGFPPPPSRTPAFQSEKCGRIRHAGPGTLSPLLILLCNSKRNSSKVDVFSSNNISLPPSQSFPSYHLSFTRRYVATAILTQQIASSYTMESESDRVATRFAHSKFCVWLSSCSSYLSVN